MNKVKSKIFCPRLSIFRRCTESKYVEGSRQRMDRPDRNDLSSEGFHTKTFSEFKQKQTIINIFWIRNILVHTNKLYFHNKLLWLHLFVHPTDCNISLSEFVGKQTIPKDCSGFWLVHIAHRKPRWVQIQQTGETGYKYFCLSVYRYRRQVKGQCDKHYNATIFHLTSKLNN